MKPQGSCAGPRAGLLLCALVLSAASAGAQCWVQGAAAPAPLLARKGHAMAYDAARGRVVLFGGVDPGLVLFGDVWEYDGDAWTPAPAGPTARHSHKMAYDSARGRIVMFGGVDDHIYRNDTWEYDGTAWSPGPWAPWALLPRSKHDVAYDAARGVVVLFGGHDQTDLFDDTWEYDGLSWQQGAPPATGLTPRAHHAMAYDGVRSLVVLFGGDDGVGNFRDDTWEYDGLSWRPGPSAPGGLEPRGNHAMTYDSARSRIVLFGGWDINAKYSDTWEYDGASWISGPSTPPARMGHALAYDSQIHRVVVFGGSGYAGFYNDTWEYGPCCGTIALSPASLPGGYTGLPYGATLAASGGTAPYTYRISAGALPPGLALSTDGAISGTPSSAGSFAFTATAMDAVGCEGSLSYALVVDACAITVSPASLPGGAAGAPYTQVLVGSGGSGPYTFSVTAGAPPPGISLTTTGVLSGTPSLAATFGFSVSATDQAGCGTTASYALTITGAPGAGMQLVSGQGLGPPNPNRVKVDRQDGSEVLDFVAYGAGQWGVNVAGGNATGDVASQIFTGPGPGAVYGPHVRGFDAAATPIKVSYYAYGTLRYGVNVATAELDQDGYDEILSGAGAGAVFGPHVRGWDFDAAAIAPMAKISYFAYGTLKWGVNVGSGDVDADGYAEILTGPGPAVGFGPVVRGWSYDGDALASIGPINFAAFSASQWGVNVAGGDVDGDGSGDILTGGGPGPAITPELRGFSFASGAVVALPGFDVTLPISLFYGARVGAGDVTGDGPAELLAGAGRDPAADATVRPYAYVGAQLVPLYAFDPFPGSGYGVNVTADALGL